MLRMRTLPAGFIAPCLPTKTDKLPSGSQWLHEIKHDGFRIIARKNGAQVRLYSCPGNDLTRRFPLIVETLARLRSFADLCSRHSTIAGRRICGERNHERFNCEPLASSAHSRRQWSQQVQRVLALLGQSLAGLDCRSLQRGQRGVLERCERAGVSIVTRTGVNVDQPAFEAHE